MKDSTILDVGCGGGILSEGLAVNGAIVTGIDMEREAIQNAKHHSKENQLKINYLCQSIEEHDRGPYDAITCMELLEHVNHPELVIAHAARLLKEGGFLFLSTINRTPEAYVSVVIAAEYILGILPRQTHDYQKFLKPSELLAMTQNVGLDTVSISGMGYHPLTRKASLQTSVKVNYLLACKKS